MILSFFFAQMLHWLHFRQQRASFWTPPSTRNVIFSKGKRTFMKLRSLRCFAGCTLGTASLSVDCFLCFKAFWRPFFIIVGLHCPCTCSPLVGKRDILLLAAQQQSPHNAVQVSIVHLWNWGRYSHPFSTQEGGETGGCIAFLAKAMCRYCSSPHHGNNNHTAFQALFIG